MSVTMSDLLTLAWLPIMGWIAFVSWERKKDMEKLRDEINELRQTRSNILDTLANHKHYIYDLSALLDQASDCLAKNLNLPESKAVIEAWRKLKGEM